MALIPVYTGPGTASAATQVWVAAIPGQLSIAGVVMEVIPGVTCAVGAADPLVSGSPTGMFVPLMVQVGMAGGPQ